MHSSEEKNQLIIVTSTKYPYALKLFFKIAVIKEYKSDSPLILRRILSLKYSNGIFIIRILAICYRTSIIMQPIFT